MFKLIYEQATAVFLFLTQSCGQSHDVDTVVFNDNERGRGLQHEPLLGPSACDTTCGRQVSGQFPHERTSLYYCMIYRSIDYTGW